MQRRDFLAVLGAGSAALLADGDTAPLRTATRPRRLERIGLELYAVRKAMRADPERTLAAIRAIGYTDVELLWSFRNFNRTTAQVREALQREGLKAPSAHMAPETIQNDWERSLATAHELGHHYLIVPSLPAETNQSLDAWKLWADRFNTAGAVARRAGIWLAFHNEPGHQKPLEGQVPIELFANATDPSVVRLQLDVGNMLLGGGNPMDFYERHQARCWSFHLKNVAADHSHDTELGAGTFDFKAFLAAIPQLNRKPCYVEQEGATEELASAKANFAYLRALRF